MVEMGCTFPSLFEAQPLSAGQPGYDSAPQESLKIQSEVRGKFSQFANHST